MTIFPDALRAHLRDHSKRNLTKVSLTNEVVYLVFEFVATSRDFFRSGKKILNQLTKFI